MSIPVLVRRVAFAVLALSATVALLVAAPGRAQASFLFTISQVGSNVVVNGSGTLNITALSLFTTGTATGEILPTTGVLFVGPASATPITEYFGSGLAGPTAFGSGGPTNASLGTGSIAGIFGAVPVLLVPSGYTSGTLLTDSSTFTGATFASLGFTPGTYTYTWGTGPTADSLTITSVASAPEPSTWALLGVGAAGLGVWGRKKRQNAECRMQKSRVRDSEFELLPSSF